MAAAHAARLSRRQGRRGRDRLYSRDRSRHAVRLEPGRLHPQLHLLPHRHAGLGAQPDGGGDRRPGAGGARPARRFSRRDGADRRARAVGRRRARGVERRLHGHGRAALQFRQRPRGDRDPDRRRRLVAVQAAHHRLDLRRRAGNGAARRRMRDDAGGVAARHQRRAARQAGAAQQEVPDQASCCRPAATIPAPPTRGASPSNT